jgi:hypothetical protein
MVFFAMLLYGNAPNGRLGSGLAKVAENLRTEDVAES